MKIEKIGEDHWNKCGKILIIVKFDDCMKGHSFYICIPQGPIFNLSEFQTV